MEATAERHTLSIMNETGDYKAVWNPNVPAEVENAREQFDDLRGKGFAIYKVLPDGGKGKVMHSFDPEAMTMIAVPRIVGG